MVIWLQQEMSDDEDMQDEDFGDEKPAITVN